MFHVLRYGEMQDDPGDHREGPPTELDPFAAGFLVGILVGEGHFGGDGKQPQVTLRMHTDHAALFQWLVERFPDSRLYGPYGHGGRSYLQWMARGPFLRDTLLPILERWMRPELSGRAWSRYQEMRQRYRLDAPSQGWVARIDRPEG
jgi:hypothetical protein